MGTLHLERCVKWLGRSFISTEQTLVVLPVGNYVKRADGKRQITEIQLEEDLTGLGLNYVGEDNSYVTLELGEVSSKSECGCCFDNDCLFVRGLSPGHVPIKGYY
jgi:hypothetical protein